MKAGTTDRFRKLLKNPANRKQIYLNALGKIKEARVQDDKGNQFIIRVIGT